MNLVLPFLPGQHDIRIVLLAVIIAAATSFVTFIAYAHLLARSSGRHGGWLLLTALCAGIGIWAAHVVMALSLVATKQSYQPLFAALSFVTAFGSATAGIALSARKGRMMAASGGAVLGLGAALTHFVGMRAFPLTGAPDLSPVLAGSAGLAAIVFSGAAMLAFREYLGKPALALASALLTAGLCIFLFTAMCISWADSTCQAAARSACRAGASPTWARPSAAR
jgi:NO-binding membrane sensor protein with MHYT domain